MKILNNKIIFPILCILVLCIGVWCGIKWRDYRNTKTVVFRISTQRKNMGYDLQAAVNYLQYKLEKQGYSVLPWRYPGAFYHQKGDNAGINIFIRSNDYLYDTRMNKNATNIYYLHRFLQMYAEEMQNYDYYLSSQKSLYKALPNYDNIGYLESGAIPHKKLTPQYQYDVLYIGEEINMQYVAFLKQNYKFAYYTNNNFGALSQEQRENQLSKARLVVYDKKNTKSNDEDYTPYAVYDIISYGRPLLTNQISSLQEVVGTNIYYYQDINDMAYLTIQALAENDNQREAKAAKAREAVITDSNYVPLNLPQKK